MRAKDQLYQYVEKRKQKIIDQYDRTLERINLSKGFESLISLMGDREMLLSIYGKSYDHNIKEILDIFSCIVDEMYQDNELFQNTTKEITHGCVIYSKGKYSIEFHSPVDWQGITVRYHGIIKPFMADAEKDYLKRLYKVKELTQKVIDKKNLKAFIDLAHLLYEKPYHTKNPITHIKRYFKVYHSIHDGLLRKTIVHNIDIDTKTMHGTITGESNKESGKWDYLFYDESWYPQTQRKKNRFLSFCSRLDMRRADNIFTLYFTIGLIFTIRLITEMIVNQNSMLTMDMKFILLYMIAACLCLIIVIYLSVTMKYIIGKIFSGDVLISSVSMLFTIYFIAKAFMRFASMIMS